jgi:hypothetical protein
MVSRFFLYFILYKALLYMKRSSAAKQNGVLFAFFKSEQFL